MNCLFQNLLNNNIILCSLQTSEKVKLKIYFLHFTQRVKLASNLSNQLTNPILNVLVISLKKLLKMCYVCHDHVLSCFKFFNCLNLALFLNWNFEDSFTYLLFNCLFIYLFIILFLFYFVVELIAMKWEKMLWEKSKGRENKKINQT